MQNEIAEVIGKDQSTVSRIMQNMDYHTLHNSYQEGKSVEEIAAFNDLWLACKTHDEIANIIGKDRSVITKIVQNFKNENLHNLENNPPESLKVFNLWNFGKERRKHYGN